MIDPQRLRDLAETLDGDDWEHPIGSAQLCRDAADEIERLRGACVESAKTLGLVLEDESATVTGYARGDIDNVRLDLLKAAKGGA